MLFKARALGFTLIELMVVIAIIGLLAAIVMAALATANSKARDAQRVSNLKEIATALELYYDQTGHYPVATGAVSECDHSGNWIPDGTNYDWSTQYFATLPRDPSEDCTSATPQAYTYQSDGTTYELTTTLENPSPPATTSQTYAYNGQSFEVTQPVVDTTPITVAFQTSASNPTNESPIPITVTFSRAVVDFSASSLSLLRGFVSSFTEVAATVYNILVTPTDNNTVVVSVTNDMVHDQNGTGNAAGQFTITYDSLLPHTALSPDPLPAEVSGPFPVSVNFTVGVVDFSAADISVSGGTVTNFAEQDASDYMFSVTPTAHGTIEVSIPSNVAHSAAGNGNVESNIISTTY